MPSPLPQFTLRIKPEVIKKLKYIADFNGNSANRELGQLVYQHIMKFERENGKIEISQITPENKTRL